MFLDGTVVGTATNAGAIMGTSSPLLIGRRVAADGRDFSVDAKMDEVAIWTRALSDAEISAIYNNGQGLNLTAPVAPTVALTAANATYTGLAYDAGANLTATVTPAAAAGSIAYAFYADAAGQTAIAPPVNAGTYYVQALFTSSSPGFTNAQSGIVPFAITPKALTVSATTQATLNIDETGTISFALQVSSGLVASNNDVAALFKGATFAMTVGGTTFNLTSTVTPNGTIEVSMRMSPSLQNALRTALSQGSLADFHLTALSNDGDYSITADVFSRLIDHHERKGHDVHHHHGRHALPHDLDDHPQWADRREHPDEPGLTKRSVHVTTAR
jgi:hypothetical protein